MRTAMMRDDEYMRDPIGTMPFALLHTVLA